MIQVGSATCEHAAVLMIDAEVHANVTPDQVPVILQKYLDKAKSPV